MSTARIARTPLHLSAALALMLMCLSMASRLFSQTLYVNCTTPPGTGNGSQTNPFTTITEAVAASRIGQTRTILVSSGTYSLSEADPISLPAGVTLEGSGMDSTLVQVSVVFSDSTTDSFANFCITDMTVRSVSSDCRGTQLHHEPEPIRIERCRIEHITLYEEVGQAYLIGDNIITGALALAYAGDSAFVVISGNVFEGGNPAYSILIAENRAIMVAIQNNEIQLHDVILTDPFAFLEFSSNDVQNGRVVLRKRHSGSWDTTFASIHDNMLRFDGTHDHPESYGRWEPAVSSEGRMVHFGSNQITCSNGENAVAIADSISWFLDNQIALESPGCGVRLHCVSGEFSGNEIRGGGCGLFEQTDSCTVTYNIIHHADTGIVARGQSLYAANLVDSCTADGLIIDGARGPFMQNEITHNGRTGVRIVKARWGTDANEVVDLGGGPDECEGGNVFRWNGAYSIAVATTATDAPVISARFNRWNSLDPDAIRGEIYDGYDEPGLSLIDCSSFVTALQPARIDAPLRTTLEQNFPNPFNPTTKVRYVVGGVVVPSGVSLSGDFPERSRGVEGPPLSLGSRAAAKVRLAVYDLLGREVAVLVDELKQPGAHTATWDASGMASGVYLCRMMAGEFVQTRTMVLIR